MAHIALYCDDGAGAFSVHGARSYFKNDNVTLITAKQILEHGLSSHIDMFIMPGGADRPYAQKLNNGGNQIIRDYVEKGGTYLGICAGAYYGCQKIDFQKGSSSEICEERELSFFKGIGVGCLQDIAPAYDQTLKSAAVTTLEYKDDFIKTLYWGGCRFDMKENENVTVLARYMDLGSKPPAIISCSVGKGRAILSGVHFEISATTFLNYDFKNLLDNHLKSELADDLPAKAVLSYEDLIQ